MDSDKEHELDLHDMRWDGRRSSMDVSRIDDLIHFLLEVYYENL